MEPLSAPIKKNSISYEIADRIMASIMSGGLKLGDRLPSERELALTMNVSRTSVREALKMLSFSKILDSKPGAGTFVINTPFESIPSSRTNALFEDSTLQGIEIRMITEPKIIRLSVVNATPEELQTMDTIVQEMTLCAESNDFSAYSLLDMQLHLLFATSSRNPDLYLLQKSYSGSAMHLTLVKQTPGELMVSLRHHMDMVEAIHQHDLEKAEWSMCRHIYYVLEKYACSCGYEIEPLKKRLALLVSFPQAVPELFSHSVDDSQTAGQSL